MCFSWNNLFNNLNFTCGLVSLSTKSMTTTTKNAMVIDMDRMTGSTMVRRAEDLQVVDPMDATIVPLIVPMVVMA